MQRTRTGLSNPLGMYLALTQSRRDRFRNERPDQDWGHDPSAPPSIMNLIDKELSQNSCTLGHSNEAGYVRQ